MADYLVKKRNGTTQPFDIAKLRKVIHWAACNLDVNCIELESNLQIHLRDNMTTKEIHETLIETALRLTTTEEPDWRILAARLTLIDFYKTVHLKRGIDYQYSYPNYYQTVLDFVEKGIYTPVLLDQYSKDELITASQFLKQTYDLDFDYAGVTLLIKRYMLEYQDAPIEMPQEALLSAALLIEQNQPADIRLERVKQTYELLAKRKISLATPILLNLRKPNGNLSSCFITSFEDNTNSIFHTFEQIGQISSSGGGVGVCLSRIRAQGSRIKGIASRAGGVIPNIRVINDIALYFNQGGKRAGAVTVALDCWHLDLEEFLELQTENGDQRRKAYDIFPQVVVSDCFMEAVRDDRSWILFDPHEVETSFGYDLPSLWGEELSNALADLGQKVDAGAVQLFKKVKARSLYKQIMKTQIETGMPYVTFKDTINRANPNPHVGMIPCTNLCVESFSVVKPSAVAALEAGDTTIGRQAALGLIHTCNLVSINLANVDLDEMPEVCQTAVRILDNCIDITDVPVPEGQAHNDQLRTIGVGLMGLADYLARHQTLYTQAGELVDQLAETFAYWTIHASIELAKERGAYPQYAGSTWSQGQILNRDLTWFERHGALRWEPLFELLATYGIRNSHIQAIAPNTSSSIVQGCTASVLPIFNRFYLDNNSNGTVPIVPPFVKDYFWYYQESKHVNQKAVVDVVSRLQRFVDTGISMELLFNLNDGLTAKDIYETHLEAWQKGVKAIYYTRSIQKESDLAAEKNECTACAG